jgi:hypothetical protein
MINTARHGASCVGRQMGASWACLLALSEAAMIERASQVDEPEGTSA